MRRAPWWLGGGWRAANARYPSRYDEFPLWARVGFMIPLGAPALMALVAVVCAALGGLALLWVVLATDAL